MRVSRKGSSALPPLRAVASILLLVAGCGGPGGDTGTSGEAESVPVTEQGTYLHIVAPSVIPRGQETGILMRVLTRAGLPDYDFEGAFRIEASSPEVIFPENFSVEPAKEGYFQMHGLVFEQTGVQFLRGSVPGDTVQAIANPVNVVANPEYRIYWGDLNGHSDLSSGSRAPGVYFWYAKAVSLLDFVALTDNDREEALDKTLDDETLHDITGVAEEEFHEDGRFIPLIGFEWTSRKYGNRLVYFSETPEELPSVAAGYDTPAKLRAALPEGSVVVVAHPSGSAHSPPADPAAVGSGGEELLEVYSTLGGFEVEGSHRATTRETTGAFVHDLLVRGVRMGVIATSDTRLTTPGNPRGFPVDDHPWPGGLTAVLAKELTRDGILEALRARRCYGTTGLRYLLEFTVDGEQMGSEIRVAKGHRASAYGSLGSFTKWVRAEIVGPDGPVAAVTPSPEEADVVEVTAETDPIQEPTFLYLRGVDEFGGMAWSSPVFLVPE